MANYIQLRLSQKDYLIKNWWDYLSQQGINISSTINYAMQYYIKTGDYLNIAGVNIVARDFTPVKTKVYLSANSDVYQWLSQRAAVGEKSATLIKRILNNSISEVENLPWIMSVDEMARLVFKIENGNYEYSSPYSQPYFTTNPQEHDRTFLMNRAASMDPSSLSNHHDEMGDVCPQNALETIEPSFFKSNFPTDESLEEVDLLGSLVTNQLEL